MNKFKMRATAGGSGEGSEIPSDGPQPAVLVAIIDLGTHEEVFEDKKKGGTRTVNLRKVFLVWELTAERCAGYDRNHMIAAEYSYTFSPNSKLRKMIEEWSGIKFAPDQEFDLDALLGKKCVVNVVHGTAKSSGNKYAQVGSLARPHKSMNVPDPGAVPFLWAIGDKEPIPDFPWMPYTFYDGSRVPVKTVIEHSLEWKKLANPEQAARSEKVRKQIAALPSGEAEDLAEGEIPNDDDVLF
jgi:hypothetical protein